MQNIFIDAAFYPGDVFVSNCAEPKADIKNNATFLRWMANGRIVITCANGRKIHINTMGDTH